MKAMSGHSAVLERIRYRDAAILAVLLNLTIWTLLPTLIEGSIRLDVAEHIIYGRRWMLVYPKHPPLSIWFVQLASQTGPLKYAAVFALGQALALCGLLCAAWLMRARNFNACAIAILFGLCTPFLAFFTIQVNHNLGVMPFWGLAMATGYFAFTHGRLRDWLLFGAAIGFGMWAKYAILQLAIPLAILFFFVDDLRCRLRTPGPWLALLLAAVIVAPLALAILTRSDSSIRYALRSSEAGFVGHIALAGGFAFFAALMMAFMGLVAATMVGYRPLKNALLNTWLGSGRDRLRRFLDVALFGPILLIILAALLFGIRPRPYWLTPISLSAILWWADKIAASGVERPQRTVKSAIAFVTLFAIGYVVIRLLAPFGPRHPGYQDFDGPAMARLAELHWKTIGGEIPYIVSLSGPSGRQAAGSILFDLNSKAQAFEDANPALSPWVKIDDLLRRGALVVATKPISSSDTIAGRAITNIIEYERPTVRTPFRNRRSIYFGLISPSPSDVPTNTNGRALP